MKAIKDNAIYLEKIVTQDDGDSDFAKVTDTAVNYRPEEITLLDDTTNTDLVTTTEVNEKDDVLLIKNDNNIVETKLGSVTIGIIDTTQTLDIFGDGSCIATYTFDGENVNDLSGNYNGTWGGTEDYENGKYGKAAKFDGSSYVNLPLHDIIDEAQKYISIWFNLTNEINEKKIIFQIDQNDAGWTNFQIYIDTDYKIVIGGRGGDHKNVSYKKVFIGSKAVSLNKWHNLIVNKNSNTYYIYLNGELIGTFDFNFYLPSNSYRQIIGAFINSPDDSDIRNQFVGLIDQFRIFNRSLTEDEISKLYNEQARKYIADISSANLSEAPKKAFKKQLPSVSIAIEATKTDITDTSFNELIPKTTTYDGSKFITVYSDLAKEGRVIQRKIVAPNKGLEIVEPFTSNLWKKG